MKRFLRLIITTVLLLALLCSTVCINSFAASTLLMFDPTVQVNKSINISLKITANESMYATEAVITFDSSKLKFNSGDSAALDGEGTVKIVGMPGGAKTQTYVLNFTAKAAGECWIHAKNVHYVGDADTPLPNASDKLTITSSQTTSSKPPVSSTPTISKNANLSSLRVKDHELSPAFSAGTTSYTVTARYPVEQVTIFASAEHSEATYVGAGTYDLKVGDNERIITVTAEDGKTKKSYFVTIKRLTEQETEEYDKQNVVSDPLAIQLNGVPHHIATDLTDVTPPTGFTATTADHKGTPVGVFENADKTYTLYWLTNDETAQGEFYTYDLIADTFTPLLYIIVNNNVYILAKLPQTYTVPAGYSIVSLPLGNTSTTAFLADEPRLADFYMLYLHYDGVTQFYRFDKAETTLQRAPYFELNEELPTDTTPAPGDLLAQFNALNQTEKILLYALGGALVLILILLVIIIVIVNRRAKGGIQEDDFAQEDIASFIDLQDASLEEPLPEVTQEDSALPVEQAQDGGDTDKTQDQNKESDDSEEW